MLISSNAFAYTRDVPSKEEPKEAPAEYYEPQQAPQPEYRYEESGGHGVVTAGYILTAVGGAAAITGSTFAVATDKHLAGVIVGAAGAALGLAGSLMIMFGSTHYALGPTIDHTRGAYGLAMSGNF